MYLGPIIKYIIIAHETINQIVIIESTGNGTYALLIL